MDSPRSLVLITVDCLRADHVGFLGYDRPTTPFLDSLAKQSLVFPTAIVGGAPTYFSFPVILAARYPLALGRDVIGLSPNEPTLASVLQQSGYATAAFVAGNPYLSSRFGYESGFNVFQDFPDTKDMANCEDSRRTSPNRLRGRLNRDLNQLCHKLGPLGTIYDKLYFQYCQRIAAPSVDSVDDLRPFPPADVVVDHAGGWLAGVTQPFFLWVHLMDPHSPYYPPRQATEWMGDPYLTPTRIRYLNSYWNRGDLRARQLNRRRKEIVALYDASIRWVDAQVSRLVEMLQQFDLLNQCIITLTADHGEQFLEHDGRFHAPSNVTEELVHVPLLVHAAGMEPPPMSKQPFSLLHLAPTLLGALGVPVNHDFEGRDFWPQVSRGEGWDGTAVIESIAGCSNPFRREDRLGPRTLAMREARYKLVLDFASRREELFDLQSDPGEFRPLPLHVERPVRRRLLERARAHLRNSHCSDSGVRMSARLRELQQDWVLSDRKSLLDVTPPENNGLFGLTAS